MTNDSEPSGWYSVRCLFVHGEPHDAAGRGYEERITLWRAGSLDHAIERAEAEAREYARDITDCRYLDFAQAYSMDGPPDDGAEIYSLIRISEQEADAYLDEFFDTGEERQQQG